MKDKFQKKKERERRVKKKILARREKMRAGVRENKKFEKLERDIKKAERKHSPELENLLQKLKEIEEPEFIEPEPKKGNIFETHRAY